MRGLTAVPEPHDADREVLLAARSWPGVIERIDPGTERYWKRIIRDGWRVGPVFRFLHRVDEAILQFIPYLRRWCWNTVIVVEKR